MGTDQDPGHGKVTDETRAFEAERDEHTSTDPGRGPTPAEEDAVEDDNDPVSDATREAYREMVERGAHQKGEGRV